MRGFLLPAALALPILFICTQFLQWTWISSLCSTLVLLYLPSYLDGSEYTVEGRYWPWFARHPLWKKLGAYFPAKVECEVPLDPNGQYIFASHPHGVMSFHHLLYLSDAIGFHAISNGARRRGVGASVIFKIPIFRDILLWLGTVAYPASVIRKVLKKGYSLTVLPGGMNEQILAEPCEHIAFIKQRKGFCKLALEAGVDIVPAYAFGENELYDTSRVLRGVRVWIMEHFHFAWTIFLGRSLLQPFAPKPVPLVCCLGAPIPVTKTAKPTQHDIDRLHATYMAELERVFDANKAKHGHQNFRLRLI